NDIGESGLSARQPVSGACRGWPIGRRYDARPGCPALTCVDQMGDHAMKRKYLSLAVAGVLLAPVQVLAQDATGPAVETTTATEDADATTLDRVTVTARRRVESIQDVPVAVTAFGEESLRDLQASSIEGLQGAVPNLN